MTAYYNEFDPFAAAWLRNLIAEGHIAPGDVDERDLWDVSPDDLRPYTQVHLCAGIGVWSYALRAAGWRDDEPIWTASFPCQPFSVAGKGLGFADERHLWPAGLHLIRQCDPPILVGEQVASKDGLAWLDLVRADLETTGRSFAAADLCAAGIGAPHIRQRTFWMANADGRDASAEREQCGGEQRQQQEDGAAIGLADSSSTRLEGGDDRTLGDECSTLERGSSAIGLADTGRAGIRDQGCRSNAGTPGGSEGEGLQRQRQRLRNEPGDGDDGGVIRKSSAGPTNGFWSDADWLACRDGKWRPVEPGTFPLAHGAANRVGRLRGYGNAIVAPVATAFIEAVIEARRCAALLT